ncbi:MAG: orotate phosphoribosyltransferase [Phycisphaerae bacterium]
MDELAKKIKTAAYLEGHFVLRSGKTSNYYLDKYLFETQPDILRELAVRFSKFVDESVDLIGGAELGGVPLAAAVALQTNKPFIIIRNSKKDYGTSKQFEGPNPNGKRVLLVEDIATTGGQVLEAAKSLTTAGAKVKKIIAVIDRQEGARENIENAGFAFESLFKKSDLGI